LAYATYINDPVLIEYFQRRHQAESDELPTSPATALPVAPIWKQEAVKLANEYISAWRTKGYEATGEDAALYVEGVFSTREIYGKRGKFLDRATIKREALKGITGRKPGAKTKLSKVPTGQRENLPKNNGGIPI
jgi:hypothetical protein